MEPIQDRPFVETNLVNDDHVRRGVNRHNPYHHLVSGIFALLGAAFMSLFLPNELAVVCTGVLTVMGCYKIVRFFVEFFDSFPDSEHVTRRRNPRGFNNRHDVVTIYENSQPQPNIYSLEERLRNQHKTGVAISSDLLHSSSSTAQHPYFENRGYRDPNHGTAFNFPISAFESRTGGNSGVASSTGTPVSDDFLRNAPKTGTWKG